MSTGRPVRARPVCFRTAWSRFGREENAFLKGRGVVRRTGVFYAEEESEAPRQDLTCGRRRDCAKEREAERRQRLSARARTEPNIADLLALMLGLSARARRSTGAFSPRPFSGLSGRGRRGPTDMRCRDWRSGFHTNADEAFGKTSSERRKRPASRKRSAGRESLSGACLPPETAGSGGCRPAGNGGPVKKNGKTEKNACQSPSFFIEKQLCPGGGIGRHTILRW